MEVADKGPLAVHRRILERLKHTSSVNLTAKERKELGRDYRRDAPGVGHSSSMIDFFEAPRITRFPAVIRLWNCAWLALKYSGALNTPNLSVKILDVGAGRAEVCQVLRAIVVQKGVRIQYTAMDVDIRKAEVFEAFYGDSKLANIYLIADAREVWPLRDKNFTAVIATEFLEHVTRPEGLHVISESYRVLTSGGHLILTTPNADIKQTVNEYHRHEWGNLELRTALEQTGYRVVEWFYFHVPVKELREYLPAGAANRINMDLLKYVLGPASGKLGKMVCAVLLKP